MVFIAQLAACLHLHWYPAGLGVYVGDWSYTQIKPHFNKNTDCVSHCFSRKLALSARALWAQPAENRGASGRWVSMPSGPEGSDTPRDPGPGDDWPSCLCPFQLWSSHFVSSVLKRLLLLPSAQCAPPLPRWWRAGQIESKAECVGGWQSEDRWPGCGPGMSLGTLSPGCRLGGERMIPHYLCWARHRSTLVAGYSVVK